jgi:tRNA (cytidine/uridine-2'-O-)-methyltransferase
MNDLRLHHGRPQLARPNLFNVALIEPEIPQNTGNIGRTCVGTRANLHLVGDLGFEITDKNLKRAGLDYWQHLWWQHYQTQSEWERQIKDPSRVFYFSAKATRCCYDVQFKPDDWLVFGKETQGLDSELLRRNEDRCLQIPILGPIRGLNVATAVAIVLYEAVRQNRLVSL